jgi:hypothetical protein
MCHHQIRRGETPFRIYWEDKDRQLESFWRETKIGDVLPWEDMADEAERPLAISKANRAATKEGHENKEQEDGQEGDEGDPHNGVIFGFGIQVHIRSKTRLQRRGRISSNDST